MKLSYGMIGESEYKKALDELEEYYVFSGNIWVERPHRGDYARGGTYEDILEIAGESNFPVYFVEFSDLESLNNGLEEFGIEVVFKTDIGKGYIYKVENIDCPIVTKNKEDIEDAIKENLKDGRGVYYYTYEEAKKALEEKDVWAEPLVMWLLGQRG